MSKKLQQKGEEVDDVQVQTQCSEDVLLGANCVHIVSHQQLSVKCQELQRETEGERKQG